MPVRLLRRQRARPSGPPFGRALLSMPVRLLCRLTGTALRAAFRSRSAVDARKAPASPTGTALRAAFRSPPAREGQAFSRFAAKRRSRHSSPQAPHPFPSALLPGEEPKTRGPLVPKASGVHIVCLDYLLKLFVKFMLTGPGTFSV